MTEEIKKYLSDIQMAIDLIEDFSKDISDFKAYEADKKTQSAIERQLAIIGEALNKVQKADPEIQIQHHK